MKLKITCAFLALAGTSFGALVSLSSVGANYNGTDDYGVVNSSGVAIAAGAGLARVGFFPTLTDVQVADLAVTNSFETLFASGNFTTITSDNFTGINTAYGATPGFVSTSVSGYNAAGLNNTLYVYITSGTDLGLFKTTSTIVADPAQPTPETNYFLSFANTTALAGGVGPAYVANPYLGAQGNVTIANSIQLEAVPEPSAALLGAIGALGLLRRRRI
jgi:hypothetical protein